MATQDDVNNLTQKMEALTDSLHKLVECNLVNDGDTEETSQRICLLNRINDLETNINGISVDDLIEKKS